MNIFACGIYSVLIQRIYSLWSEKDGEQKDFYRANKTARQTSGARECLVIRLMLKVLVSYPRLKPVGFPLQ